MNRRSFFRRLAGAALGAAAACYAPGALRKPKVEVSDWVTRARITDADLIESLHRHYVEMFFYGSSQAGPSEFTGFAPRYSDERVSCD